VGVDTGHKQRQLTGGVLVAIEGTLDGGRGIALEQIKIPMNVKENLKQGEKGPVGMSAMGEGGWLRRKKRIGGGGRLPLVDREEQEETAGFNIHHLQKQKKKNTPAKKKNTRSNNKKTRTNTKKELQPTLQKKNTNKNAPQIKAKNRTGVVLGIGRGEIHCAFRRKYIYVVVMIRKARGGNSRSRGRWSSWETKRRKAPYRQNP